MEILHARTDDDRETPLLVHPRREFTVQIDSALRRSQP